MASRKLMILDGYTDEPAGLGVPPYIDVYPRYIAGAAWSVDKSLDIRYVTVDEARRNIHGFLKEASRVDVLVVIAGVTVPGRYLSGHPIEAWELGEWFNLVEGPVKVLVGPAARFGLGREGGRVAGLPRSVKHSFDYIVRGDPEVFIHTALLHGFDKADPAIIRRSYSEIEGFARRGARIIKQHPNYGYNLVVEVETYRGCPRSIRKGCSFCTEVLYGRPSQRRAEDIVEEIKALYNAGARNFRLGRQPDILVYGSPEIGVEENPRPEPSMLEKLFRGIREAAPSLETLHIDNVNPATIALHEDESIQALKTIVRLHTPGDVAAMGVETADPKVVKANNLKVMPEDALKAIRIVNRIGAMRGYNGMPELLPGINFVLGLMGETRETYRLNYEFLEKILVESLLIRRINIRKVLVFPHTPMWSVGDTIIRRHLSLARSFARKVREKIDKEMMRRIVPRKTILRGLYVEKVAGKWSYARHPGSYPLTVQMPCIIRPPAKLDAVVYSHGARSIKALPIPLRPGNPSSILALLPSRTPPYISPKGFSCMEP